MATRTISPTTHRHGDHVPAIRAKAGAPPPDTWPLLGTIATTLGIMYGAILWVAAPAVTGVIVAGAVTGLAALLALAVAFSLAIGARSLTVVDRRPQPRTT
jgi:hypothetical protein